jgi:hypothetical protein
MNLTVPAQSQKPPLFSVSFILSLSRVFAELYSIARL